jgi:LysM repeat protein
MRSALRQIFWGIATGLVSIILILGGFSISLAEGNLRAPAATTTPTQTSTQIPTPTPSETPTLQQVILPMDSPTAQAPTGTSSPSPSPTSCPPPSGWTLYTIQPGDTLGDLAIRYKKTSSEIIYANCLATSSLIPGMVIYLPPVATQTPVPCALPLNWVVYYIQPGDTLYHLGQVYGIPYTEIQHANCLTSTQIHIGQRLYVPPWAPHTPSPTLFPILPQPSDTPWAYGTYSTGELFPTDAGLFTDTPVDSFPPSPTVTAIIP